MSFIVNVQYEYNWIRLRQLAYLSEVHKVVQKWDPSAGYTIRSPFHEVHFWDFLVICADGGTDGDGDGRTDAGSSDGPEERNRRFAQYISHP